MLKFLCVVVIISLLQNEATARKKLCCNGPNESYSAKKVSCPPDTCRSLVTRYICTNATVAPGCVCDSGYKRPEEGQDCVPICDCTEMRGSLDCQPKCDD